MILLECLEELNSDMRSAACGGLKILQVRGQMDDKQYYIPWNLTCLCARTERGNEMFHHSVLVQVMFYIVLMSFYGIVLGARDDIAVVLSVSSRRLDSGAASRQRNTSLHGYAYVHVPLP